MPCFSACRFSGRVGYVAALVFFLQFVQPTTWAQNAVPTAVNAPLQNYVEEFILSDAVRSEDKGETQFTLSAEGLRHRGTDSALDLEYGITNRLQFTFEAPYGIQPRALSDTPMSWSAVSIGGQYQLIRSNHPFALSAAFAVGVPLNARGEMEYEPEILLAKGVGRSQLHFSAGGELGDDDKSWNYNAAWVRPVSRQWLTSFEFNGRRTDGANGVYFTPGIYHHLFPRFAKRIEAGAGVPTGFGPAASHIGIAAKLTVEFGSDDDD